MKNFKRISSVVLAIVMVFAMMVPAMASDYVITVNNAFEGETYNAYKLFDAAYSGTPVDGVYPNFSYTYEGTLDDAGMTLLKGFKVDGESAFIFTPAAGKTGTFVVSTVRELTEADAAALAAYLQKAQDAGNFPFASAADEKADGTGSVTLDVGTPGYYFVDTTTGSLCAIDTTQPAVTVRDKNTAPTIAKTVDEAFAQIGDEVNFEITVTAQPGAEKYVVHDTADAGLTVDMDSIVITGLTEGADYNVVADPTDECTFEIEFTESYLDGITNKDTVITITYKAVVDGVFAETIYNDGSNDGRISDADRQFENKVILTYGAESETAEAKTETGTFALEIFKHDNEGNGLENAKFELYDKDGNKVELIYPEVNNPSQYYVANEAQLNDDDIVKVTEVVSDADGVITIFGLDNENYSLVETEAPEGFNLLDAPVDITVAHHPEASTIYTASIAVLNQSGIELPATGGIGTTIFYLVGGLMVTGAFVLLMTKKRMGNRA